MHKNMNIGLNVGLNLCRCFMLPKDTFVTPYPKK